MADRLKAGAKLIVVDPARTATADRADLYLPIKPGTDLALAQRSAASAGRKRRYRPRFHRRTHRGWADMPEFLADYRPHRVAEITGLAEADIRTAAAMIAAAVTG
jgi:anaerobic selenocysteine-containing dehydrogenase